MKKFLSLIFMLALTLNAYSGNQWRDGTGADTILGATNISDIDAASFQNMTDPSERLLSSYKRGCRVEYLSAATLTVTLGEVMLHNSDSSVRLMQQNAANTTVTWADIDTGAEANSTTYYVYAFQETATDTDFDVTISSNSSTPSGKTNWQKLGSFYNNSSGNIEAITNDDDAVDADAVVKGWINFNGSGTIAINDSYNVTSITDNGIGDYTITWDKDFTNAYYAVSGMSTLGASKEVSIGIVSQAVGTVNISMKNYDGASVDPTIVCLMAIGDQ